MSDLTALSPGQVITISDGRHATIRFAGNTHFAPGEWVGIELESATGKNDGSVSGERYFDCAMGYGMFIRPSAVSEIVEQPKPAAAKVNGRPVSGTPAKARPSSGATGLAAGPNKRQSMLGQTGASKRMSLNPGSPTPGARGPATGLRGSGVRSPIKSPTKQMASTTSSGASTPGRGTPSAGPRTSIGGTKPRIGVSNRTSMGPPAAPASTTRTSRPSLAPPSRQSLAPTPKLNGNSTRLSAHPTPPVKALPNDTADQSDEQETVKEEEDEETESTPLPTGVVRNETSDSDGKKILSQSSDNLRSTVPQKPSPRSGLSPASTQKPFSHTTSNREVEDLKAKLRIMEKKRVEDREKLKSLERLQGERDKFEGIIQKLQTKYQPQQQEIADLRKQLKEAEAKVDQIERQEAEHESALEMATLDREMAEETAEAYKTEFEALKMKTEELELEVEVLREENQELGQVMSPEEKSSQGWLQMDRTNERLREALLRLRDLTQQTESDLKAQVKELEEDLEDLGDVKNQYEVITQKLQQSEANVEELRQQLDSALGAEEMIEELTDKNMEYQEYIENLKATIEDLESLKELNDELEMNHMETEKQLQEEIDFKDGIFVEQTRKVTQQDETIVDLEYMLSKFRELVTNLQGDLEDMRASQQISETEATELTSRSKAMMDLNLKLHASAARAQVKTIDMELRRLEAQEAADHLSMVRLFLPESFSSERDPILALLRFKRISFKANLLSSLVRDRIADQALGHDDVFSAYDVLEKLTWISSTCDRFVNAIGSCDVDSFSKVEGALYELEPVERGLNGWVEGLKKGELNDKQCAVELQRSISLLSHLTEQCMPSNSEAFADGIHMHALLIQTYLDNTAAAFSHVKALINSKVSASEDEESSYLPQRLDSLSTQARSAKVVVGKIARSVEDLKSRSLSLDENAEVSFQDSEDSARELSSYTRRIGEDLHNLLGEEGRSEPYTFSEVIGTMRKSTSTIFDVPSTEADSISTFGAKLRTLSSQLESLSIISTDLSQAQEFERLEAPWTVRAREIKSSKVISADTEDELRRLKMALQDRSTALGLRDNTIEEANIKIELLESRIREANKKSTLIHNLENKLEAAKKREKELSSAMEAQAKELKAMEKERESSKDQVTLNQISTGPEATGTPLPQDHFAMVTATKTMSNLKIEITSLEATIRFLQRDNDRLRLMDPSKPEQNLNSWLSEPLVTRKPSREQEKKKQATRAECHDILNSLLAMTKDAKNLDLGTPFGKEPGKSTIWRPFKESPKWRSLKMREEWETWRDWRTEVVKRERGWEGRLGSSVPPLAKIHSGIQRLSKVSEFGAQGLEILI